MLSWQADLQEESPSERKKVLRGGTKNKTKKVPPLQKKKKKEKWGGKVGRELLEFSMERNPMIKTNKIKRTRATNWGMRTPCSDGRTKLLLFF